MGLENGEEEAWFELFCGEYVILDEGAYCLFALESRKLDEI